MLTDNVQFLPVEEEEQGQGEKEGGEEGEEEVILVVP